MADNTSSGSSTTEWSASGSGSLSSVHLTPTQIESGIDTAIDGLHLAFPNVDASHSGTPGTGNWSAQGSGSF